MNDFGRNKVQPIRKQKDIENCFVYLLRKVKSIDNQKQPVRYQISLRNYFLIYLGINVGLRISDLRTIKAAAIRKGFIQLREKKTGKIQQIPLHKEVQKKIMNEYIKELNLDDETYIFVSRKGYNSPISPQAAYDIIKGIAGALGWNFPVGTHTLRKTFGYHYYQETNNIVVLQKMFNHNNPQTTLLYCGIVQENIDSERMTFRIKT